MKQTNEVIESLKSKRGLKIGLISLLCLILLSGAIYGIKLALDSKAKQQNASLASSSSFAPVVVPVLAIPTTPPSPSVNMLFDQYGFEPNEFVVPVGVKINVSNGTDKPLNFKPLPAAIGNLPGLDLGTIEPGDTKSFVVSSVGSWQFEANDSPALRGDISGVNQPLSSWSGLSSKSMPTYNPTTKSLLINYTNFGFVPNIITVPVGTKVTVLNSTDEGSMQFAALNNDPSFNIGIINLHQSASFTLVKAGTWQYENTWETTDIGQITAE